MIKHVVLLEMLVLWGREQGASLSTWRGRGGQSLR
jgi:hypothetical protein